MGPGNWAPLGFVQRKCGILKGDENPGSGWEGCSVELGKWKIIKNGKDSWSMGRVCWPLRMIESCFLCRCWLEQTLNSCSNLEFSQAGTLREIRVILGTQPWAVRNCVSVCSSPCRPKLTGLFKKQAQRSLARIFKEHLCQHPSLITSEVGRCVGSLIAPNQLWWY